MGRGSHVDHLLETSPPGGTRGTVTANIPPGDFLHVLKH